MLNTQIEAHTYTLVAAGFGSNSLLKGIQGCHQSRVSSAASVHIVQMSSSRTGFDGSSSNREATEQQLPASVEATDFRVFASTETQLPKAVSWLLPSGLRCTRSQNNFALT